MISITSPSKTHFFTQRSNFRSLSFSFSFSFDILSVQFRTPIKQSSEVRSCFRLGFSFSFSLCFPSKIEFTFIKTFSSKTDSILFELKWMLQKNLTWRWEKTKLDIPKSFWNEKETKKKKEIETKSIGNWIVRNRNNEMFGRENPEGSWKVEGSNRNWREKKGKWSREVNWTELIENWLVEENIVNEEKEEKDSKCFGIGALFEM
jgi:hypothetical protein